MNTSPIYERVYDWLYHGISLRACGLVLGVVLIALHVWALLRATAATDWLRKAPRDKPLGIALLTVDLVWAMLIVSAMDMGEFWRLRRYALVLIPVAYGLMIAYVEEFLAARALGMLLLLLAGPVLDAAFLELPTTRLLLPILAYVWIGFGLFWVGMPYLMRDHLGWATATQGRFKSLAAAGAGYGLLLLVCAVTLWK